MVSPPICDTCNVYLLINYVIIECPKYNQERWMYKIKNNTIDKLIFLSY